MTAMFSKKDKLFYKKYGYLVKKKFFSKKECKNLLSTLLNLADDEFSPILNADRLYFAIAQSKKKLNKIKKLSEMVDFINKVQKNCFQIKEHFLNKKIIKNLNFLYSRKIVGLQTQTIFKKPFTKYSNQSFNEHQDNSYAKNPNGLFFGAHTYLSKNTKSNGCLYVYPESHKLNLLKFKRKISYREKNNRPGNKISNKRLANFKRIDLLGNAGDLIIMHGNLVHGSHPNKSKKFSRPIFAGFYIPSGETFVPGKNAQRKIIRPN